MDIFILLSVHLGMLAIITGTGIGARHNWVYRRWTTAVICGLHCALWSVAYVGLVIETFGGAL